MKRIYTRKFVTLPTHDGLRRFRVLGSRPGALYVVRAAYSNRYRNEFAYWVEVA